MTLKFCEIYFHRKKRFWYYGDYGVVLNETKKTKRPSKICGKEPL